MLYVYDTGYILNSHLSLKYELVDIKRLTFVTSKWFSLLINENNCYTTSVPSLDIKLGLD